ncbi:MAG TPA: hypothetical protein VNL37_01125 [Candidatus Polarisedimenticolia bacterium]|nr:hypothetical protein [Candidatus Polarisedimenticolia bacterium]
MNLMTAHRILIGTSIVFFVFYGVWEFAGGAQQAGAGPLLRGAAALACGLGLGLYFRTLFGPRGGSDKGGAGGQA